MANDFHRFAVESGRSPRSAACAFVGLGVLALTSTFGASATGDWRVGDTNRFGCAKSERRQRTDDGDGFHVQQS